MFFRLPAEGAPRASNAAPVPNRTHVRGPLTAADGDLAALTALRAAEHARALAVGTDRTGTDATRPDRASLTFLKIRS